MTLRKRHRPKPKATRINQPHVSHGIFRAFAASGAQVGHITSDGQYHDTRVQNTLKTVLYAALLPRGYPASVPPDYMTYQLYDTLQGVCSYVRGQLTAKAVLLAAGVGNANATALSAVSVFVLRDMAGHLASLLFVALYNSSFRARAKQWRLFADIANSIGLFVELCTPRVGKFAFITLLAFGSVLRAVCGAAAGAARVSFSHHFAKGCTDPADVASKEGAQETVASLVGMALGWLANLLTDGRPVTVWILFVGLTIAHAWCNVRAVRSISIATLDVDRLRSVIEMGDRRVAFRDALIPRPFVIARSEALLPSFVAGEKALHWMAVQTRNVRVSVGANVQWVLSAGGKWKYLASAEYVIVPIISTTGGGTLAVLLRSGACNESQLAASWVAAHAAISITGGIDAGTAIVDAQKQLLGRGGVEQLSDALIRNGWDLSPGVLGDGGNRIEWMEHDLR